MNKRDISINSLEELKAEDASGGNRKITFKIIDTIEKKKQKQFKLK